MCSSRGSADNNVRVVRRQRRMSVPHTPCIAHLGVLTEIKLDGKRYT